MPRLKTGPPAFVLHSANMGTVRHISPTNLTGWLKGRWGDQQADSIENKITLVVIDTKEGKVRASNGVALVAATTIEGVRGMRATSQGNVTRCLHKSASAKLTCIKQCRPHSNAPLLPEEAPELLKRVASLDYAYRFIPK